MNLYRQVYFLRLKILHCHNRQQVKQYKIQLAELTAQLPPTTEDQKGDITECF